LLLHPRAAVVLLQRQLQVPLAVGWQLVPHTNRSSNCSSRRRAWVLLWRQDSALLLPALLRAPLTMQLRQQTW
jgi:hypothetical protein